MGPVKAVGAGPTEAAGHHIGLEPANELRGLVVVLASKGRYRAFFVASLLKTSEKPSTVRKAPHCPACPVLGVSNSNANWQDAKLFILSPTKQHMTQIPDAHIGQAGRLPQIQQAKSAIQRTSRLARSAAQYSWPLQLLPHTLKQKGIQKGLPMPSHFHYV